MALTFLNYRLHPKEWAWILDDAEAIGADRRALVPRPDPSRVLGEVPARPARRSSSAASGDEGTGRLRGPRRRGVRRPRRPSTVDEDDTAWLIYTSGTTGFPKGAMLTHRNLVTAVIESVIEYQPQPDERNLLAFPLCHVAGYPVPVNHLRGGLVVLMRAYEPELFMQLVERPPHHRHRPGPDDAQLPAPAPEDRRVRPVDAAQHRLRRGRDAGRGAEVGRSTASARSCTPASA